MPTGKAVWTMESRTTALTCGVILGKAPPSLQAALHTGPCEVAHGALPPLYSPLLADCHNILFMRTRHFTSTCQDVIFGVHKVILRM